MEAVRSGDLGHNHHNGSNSLGGFAETEDGCAVCLPVRLPQWLRTKEPVADEGEQSG